jgi:uncharacterized protein (TIRG00374 family)
MSMTPEPRSLVRGSAVVVAGPPVATVGEMPDELGSHHLRRRVAQLGLALVIVAVAVTALPGLDGVRRHFAHVQPAWLVIALAAELGSALSYVGTLRAVFCPCMRWGPTYQLGMSELAANSLLPAGGAGGLALGAWALHRCGVSSHHIAQRTVVFFLVTSAASFAAVILAGLGLAAGILPGRASPALTVAPALIAAAVVLVVVVVLPRILDRVALATTGTRGAGGVWAGVRRRVVASCSLLAQGVRDSVTILRSGPPLMIAGSIGYMAFDVVVLAAAFRATGSAVPPLGVLVLAYTIGQLGGLVPIPGGLGATGGGLIGALVLYGAPVGASAAAVLVYRTVQVGLPALLGTPAFVILRRSIHRSEADMTICEPLAEQHAPA